MLVTVSSLNCNGGHRVVYLLLLSLQSHVLEIKVLKCMKHRLPEEHTTFLVTPT